MTEHQIPLAFASLEALTVEELWAGATIELLSRLREDRRIERKPAGIHAAELAQYFSMWANTIDGGLIVVGMENDGALSGCTVAGGRVNRLETHARDSCPDALVETRIINGKRKDGAPDYALLMRVRYNASKVVKTTAGEAFVRSGDSKKKLKPEEIRELEIDKGQVDVEIEPFRQYEFPVDFMPNLVSDFISTVRERTQYSDELSDTEVLELRRLGTRRDGVFIPNAACVLMFARDPMRAFPGCSIRFLRYDGEIEGTGAKWNVVKDLAMEGPVPMLIDMADKALSQQLRDFSRLGDDGKFYTAAEYPKAAWYEAIVNACAHRSYGTLKNMNIFVRMFDDRLEIESPGAFPPPVTPENVYEMHHPRNPILMGAMQMLNYVKCAREGTRRMRETLSEFELPPPHFAQKEAVHSVVKVTLRNNIKIRKVWVDSDAVSILGADLARTLSPTEIRAINFIIEHGEASVSEVSRLLANDWRTSLKLLEGLSARKILFRNKRTDIDRDPKARYMLVPRPRPS